MRVGYHVYKDGWSPVPDQVFSSQYKIGNAHDPLSVKAMKSRSIIGHSPKKIISMCSMFLRPGAVINCKKLILRSGTQEIWSTFAVLS